MLTSICLVLPLMQRPKKAILRANFGCWLDTLNIDYEMNFFDCLHFAVLCVARSSAGKEMNIHSADMEALLRVTANS